MSRSTRMFEIVQTLRSAKGPMAADAMAHQLEVTKRTIYRDIAALKARRVPIEGEAGIGYIMRPGLELPPLMFTSEEVEAIVVGLALLRRSGDAGLERAAAQVSAKIADVLPDGSVDVPLHVSGWNKIPSPSADPGILRRAIREEAKLRLLYLDLKNVRTECTVQPISLLYHVDALNMAGWCELRAGFRHFRIDRIEAWERTGEHFPGKGDTLRKAWLTEHELP